MTKMTILGLLAVIEIPDKPEEKTASTPPAPPAPNPLVPLAKKIPTLDELFAQVFGNEKPPENHRRDHYETIFAQ
jgi:hypothetical protein